MAVDPEDLRLAIYRSFAVDAHALDLDELALEFDTSVDDIRDGLHQLASSRYVVLDELDRIVMAHPFASQSFGFSVLSERNLWWGGCAWDSFAIAHLLPREAPVLVATRCPGCGAPHAWNVGPHEPPPGEQVAHFLVPAAQMWDDVVYTCGHQRIFCSDGCVDAWLDASGNDRGYVMDLPTLWRLASGWYDGRLDRGYQRREPAAAADYLRSVGLDGPFWLG